MSRPYGSDQEQVDELKARLIGLEAGIKAAASVLETQYGMNGMAEALRKLINEEEKT